MRAVPHFPLLQDSFLVSILAEHGFQYHTTTAKELTMTRWLPDTPSELSQRGLNHHSVIGVVLDKDGRILMIQERRRIQHGWKFPGGRANDSEPIFHTAKRKVAEETGINAEPLALIALRHKVLKTYSNIGSFFFFCLMRVNYESGVEEPELPTPPDEFTVWWFTK
ncbi:hydrolase, NUDIX family [Ancylostoma ceylanicum]|uniref:Hydrolase, NUDIX family n=1 Tax=Ancylostoma ceylanicum TaxID=53326 RepID=A0A0D6L5A4_9BILA|nr:hydrolase, NUDIX family [Ancylostoma ceylanicum]